MLIYVYVYSTQDLFLGVGWGKDASEGLDAELTTLTLRGEDNCLNPNTIPHPLSSLLAPVISVLCMHPALALGVGRGLNSCAERNVKVNRKNRQVTVQILHNTDTDRDTEDGRG